MIDDSDPEHLRCRVIWAPRGGEPVTVEGDHLNNWVRPTLACGIEQILSDLDLWGAVGDHRSRIVQAVNYQLERRPWAVIECPMGTARLEVVT